MPIGNQKKRGHKEYSLSPNQKRNGNTTAPSDNQLPTPEN